MNLAAPKFEIDILDRGYAIVSNMSGDILRDAADAPAGTPIEARLARGRLRAKVEGNST